MSDNVQRITVTQQYGNQPIYVNPDPDGNVTILDNTEVIEARKSYFGETFDTLQERLMNDFNGVLDKVGTVNYKGTTIHANNTYARNLVANRNKVEVLGQTIQNLVDDSNIWKTENTFETQSSSNVSLSTYGQEYFSKSPLKVSTKYTIFIDYEIKNNTLENYYIAINQLQSGTTQTSLVIFNKTDIDNNVKFKVVTTNELFNGIAQIFLGGKNGSITFKNNGFMILEGDWTNKEISFVPFGLNYPKTTEIIATSKNLINADDYYSKYKQGDEYVANTSIHGIHIPLKDYIGKQMMFSIKGAKSGDGTYYLCSFINGVAKVSEKISTSEFETITLMFTPQTENDYCYITYGNRTPILTFNEVMLAITDVEIPYEPYTERRININYPLASVSDTLRDKYYVKNGKKYHDQVVKEIVFDGSDDEDWKMQESTTETGKNIRFYIDIPNGINLLSRERVLCNRFYYMPSGFYALGCFVYDSRFYCYTTGNNIVAINVNSVDEFKKWLSSNIVNAIYELATPITTEIETEDMQSFDGQTNITTTNIVKPTLDIDIPSDLNAVVSNLMVENTSLKQENQSLTNELENQKAVNEENTLLMNTILGVE